MVEREFRKVVMWVVSGERLEKIGGWELMGV